MPLVLGLTLMCPRILGFLNAPTDAWPVAELAREILTVRNNQALGPAGETRIGGLDIQQYSGESLLGEVMSSDPRLSRLRSFALMCCLSLMFSSLETRWSPLQEKQEKGLM